MMALDFFDKLGELSPEETLAREIANHNVTMQAAEGLNALRLNQAGEIDRLQTENTELEFELELLRMERDTLVDYATAQTNECDQYAQTIIMLQERCQRFAAIISQLEK